MVALLAQVAKRAVDLDFYVGEHEARKLRVQFASIDAFTPPRQRWQINRLLGHHELRLGHAKKAIRHATAAYALLKETGPSLSPTAVCDTIFQLAVTYLRYGENANCVGRHTPESCIFPIRGGGVHVNREGSENAIRYFTEVLEIPPDESTKDLKLAARWLLNIAYMTLGGYPQDVPAPYRIAPETFASEEPCRRFTEIAPRLGLNVFGLCGGVIVDDFDNDGDLDIAASDWNVDAPLRYFVHNADGTFTERTTEAGLTGLFGGLNMLQADYNNDGWTDILVLRGAWLKWAGRRPNSLIRNNGNGTFTDVTFDAGLAEVHYPTQTAGWRDYDNDGHLDLYIGNEYLEQSSSRFPSQLFHNNGDGTFTDVAASAGVENKRYAKGVSWGDYDADRFPDLYVSNLNGRNRLYHNNGDGTFTDVAPRLGLTLPVWSFPTWFWDFDNDGHLDLYVTTYWFDSISYVAASYLGLSHEAEPARLYRGDGRGGFEEVAAAQNLTKITQPMGSNFGDFDGDGYLDFYLGTGYPGYEGLSPNVLYHNRGGTGFADVTSAAGLGHLQKGHGVAFADLDHDGDQDIYMCVGGAYAGDGFGNALFENPGFDNHWIVIKFVGTRTNRCAIGARIRADVTEDGTRRSIYKHVNSGGSFGASPLRQYVGLGQAAKIDRLEIDWPTSDTVQTFTDVANDQFIEITEGKDMYRQLPYAKLDLSPARAEAP